ncbi:hypothetical protein [Streptomyces cacaoi]|uniref:hypothetical protein n=1 Tax=Streptomyces cacaoi TaxID=1898 RepID=UPI00262684CB|nr:hypothetical protein [Streptomyces cacaoi]
MSGTTKVMAVVGLVLCAATGCVAAPDTRPEAAGVHPSPGRSPYTGDAPGSAAPGAGAGEDRATAQLVEAPVREALSRAADDERTARPGTQGSRSAPPPGARTPEEALGARPPRQPEAAPGHPAAAHRAPDHHRTPGTAPGPASRQPHRATPPQEARPARPARPPARSPAPRGTGVCELGETYGRWAADSAQARICRSTYGG